MALMMKYERLEGSVSAVVRVDTAEYDDFGRALVIRCGRRHIKFPMSEENGDRIIDLILYRRRLPENLVGSEECIFWDTIDRLAVVNNAMCDEFFSHRREKRGNGFEE